MIRGSCLCGDVAWQVDGPVELMSHCHCSRCRKSHGAAFATALSTCPELSRVARPFASAGNVGTVFSHPAGRSRFSIVWSSAASVGNFLAYSSKSFRHAACASAPRLPIPFLNWSYTPSGTRNCESSGHP